MASSTRKRLADRPADQRGDHRCAPEARGCCGAMARRSTVRPSPCLSKLKRTAGPSSGPRQLPRRLSLKGMRHRRPLQRRHRLVVERDARSARWLRSHPGLRARTAACGRADALAAPAAERAITPCRLASESIRNCPDATTCWPGGQAAAHDDAARRPARRVSTSHRPVAARLSSATIDQRALAGADHRLGRHHQRLAARAAQR